MDSDCFSIEGQQKMMALAAMKKIRYGGFLDKCKGWMLFLKHGRLYDWATLVKVIIEVIIQKAGIADMITWIRMKRI